MAKPIRLLTCVFLTLASGAFALSSITVEKASVGSRELVLTFDDSILAPDLSKLQIEGYSIENAVFIEEMDSIPTRFAPKYLDLTLPGNGTTLNYLPTPGTLFVDLPDSLVPQVGAVIADTAFGGLLRRVIAVDGQSESGLIGRRWVLNTVAADLPEAVLDCDLAFKTRLDMTQIFPAITQDQDVLGDNGEGAPIYGRMELSLTGAQILFQPVVTGRIRIRNGRVELFQFQVMGNCEVAANMAGTINGNGNFNYEEELPGQRPTLVPLGSGLFLKVQNRPFLKMDALSPEQGFSAEGSFRIKNAFKGELGLNAGQWRPMAENSMTLVDKSVREFKGAGEMKLSLKPRIEVLFDGVQGPAFIFEPFARFSSLPEKSSPFQAESTSVSLPGGAPGLIGVGNKQVSLGANIYMDMRTNFIGPATMRSVLLFNREQMMLSPPREGTLAFKETDSSKLSFLCQTFPKSDSYILQQKLDAGPWITVLDQVVNPKIKLASLKPNSSYRFRAMGVNAMGIGPAFPPEGLAFQSPSLNHPPFVPVPLFPDSQSVVPDSAILLTWKGGDPDLGAKVLYTVLVDTHYPPIAVQSSGIADTALELAGLALGQRYYWKIIASDGIDRSESAVRTFSLTARLTVVHSKSEQQPAGFPLVLVPKGAYHREDGSIVQVGPFLLDKTEVTQGQYQKVVGKNPSYRFSDSLPVDRVTWEEAASYCQETGGRLPTEAEWEYAARSGDSGAYYWGRGNAGEYAWYRDNSDNHSQKVGLKKPNAWGLHDMSGNVFEWVQDWYAEYGRQDVDHPKGPATGTTKVIRGASWYSEAANLELSARYNNRPGFRNFKVGFRCAKDVQSPELGELNGRASSFASKTVSNSTLP